jgi:hypothetical protein
MGDALCRSGSSLRHEDDLRASPFRRVGHGVRVLVNIQPDEQRGIVSHG